MRPVALLFLIEAILSAGAKPETFRWDSWQTQDPKASVEETPLPPEDRTAVQLAIIEILKRGRVAQNLSVRELQELAESARVKLVDVTGDAVPEVMAVGGTDFLCSPTGNCPWWVLTKQGD